jgi:hypothetical protein
MPSEGKMASRAATGGIGAACALDASAAAPAIKATVTFKKCRRSMTSLYCDREPWNKSRSFDMNVR